MADLLLGSKGVGKDDDDNPWSKEAANVTMDEQPEETMADHLKTLTKMAKTKNDRGNTSSNLSCFYDRKANTIS